MVHSENGDGRKRREEVKEKRKMEVVERDNF